VKAIFLPLQFFVYGFLLLSNVLWSDVNVILGGGSSTPTPYLTYGSQNGTTTPVALSFPTGYIKSVAGCSSGDSLIGGQNGASAYVAQVSPTGVVTSLNTSASLIRAVAMNDSRLGLIGGVNGTSGYAAQVSVNGTVTPLFSAASSGIYSVDINSSGKGIICGYTGGSNSYAALVAPSGSLTVLGTPGLATLFGCDINNGGNGILGGISFGNVYAARVSSGGGVTFLTFTNTGRLWSVALNDSEQAIMGGQTNSNIAIAGIITAPSTTVTNLGLGFTGIINSVAINSSAVGIIGGQNGSNAYAAFVSPTGVVQQISLSSAGNINSVAIHDTGIGLIGGQIASNYYAALVAPNGTVTPFSLPAISGQIYGVAFTNLPAVSPVIPESFGPFGSLARVVFDCSDVMVEHSALFHKNFTFARMDHFYETKRWKSEEIGLVADAGLEIGMSPLTNEESISSEHLKNSYQFPSSIEPKTKKNSVLVWATPFADYSRQEAEGKIPAYSNKIIGIVAAAEYQFLENRQAVIGGGFAYAFDAVHYFQRIGHGEIHQELALVYGSWNRPHFFLNLSLWGGCFQMDNRRFSLDQIVSKSKPHGFLLSPHLEISFPFYKNSSWFLIEPFVLLDWANSWQKHFHEYGSSGLNIALKGQYSSLLRSEAGLRFYEILRYKWGRFLIEEAMSFVNKKPFHTRSNRAFFVGSLSSFSVETVSSKMQNLAMAHISFHFFPNKERYPFGALMLQSEIGQKSSSYLLFLTMGKNF
jgi:hypothetical protein